MQACRQSLMLYQMLSAASQASEAQMNMLLCRIPEHCNSGAVREMDCSWGMAALHAGPPCAKLPGALQVWICTHCCFLQQEEKGVQRPLGTPMSELTSYRKTQNRCPCVAVLLSSATPDTSASLVKADGELDAPSYSGADVNCSPFRDELWKFLGVDRWPVVAEVSRKVLGWRLKALPYLYSAFYDSHTFGCPIARPLWFNFPSDPATLRLQEQWMMGGHLTPSCARNLS